MYICVHLYVCVCMSLNAPRKDGGGGGGGGGKEVSETRRKKKKQNKMRIAGLFCS